MKVYRSGDLRKAKTDKIDSRIIANYGIEHWFTMAEFKASDDVYGELKMLGQQYRHYMKGKKFFCVFVCGRISVKVRWRLVEMKQV